MLQIQNESSLARRLSPAPSISAGVARWDLETSVRVEETDDSNHFGHGGRGCWCFSFIFMFFCLAFVIARRVALGLGRACLQPISNSVAARTSFPVRVKTGA